MKSDPHLYVARSNLAKISGWSSAFIDNPSMVKDADFAMEYLAKIKATADEALILIQENVK